MAADAAGRATRGSIGPKERGPASILMENVGSICRRRQSRIARCVAPPTTRSRRGSKQDSRFAVPHVQVLVALATLALGASSLFKRMPSGEKLAGIHPTQHLAVMGFTLHHPFVATRRRLGRAPMHHSSLGHGRPQQQLIGAAAIPATPPKASERMNHNISDALMMNQRNRSDKNGTQPQGEYAQALLSAAAADRRPHVQRVAGPRPARRLNHAFRYLYRGPTGGGGDSSSYDNDGQDFGHEHDQRQFLLRVGYTEAEIVNLCRRFPPVLQLPVTEQLAPKVRFLRDTIHIDLSNSTERGWVPPEYFGLKLEAVVAPRHAFLMHAKLPCGRKLVESAGANGDGGPTTTLAAYSQPELWLQFVKNCRQSTKHFAAFCQSLQSVTTNSRTAHPTPVYPVIASRHVEAFQTVFSRGLLAAARDDLVQANNTAWQPLEILDRLHSSDLVSLLIAHGANATERDHRGATLLHWACGTGNLRAAHVLSRHVSVSAAAERDGATPLHWAAAGATPREFGTGGHADVCQYLMEQVQTQQASSTTSKRDVLREYINQPTKDGNTPLMWAGWSGTLDTVKLLVRSRADVAHRNRNGCTVAHWASSGGNVQVCRYLHDVAHADFQEPNYGGNTPLTHAVAFGRADIVAWLTKEVLVPATEGESLSSLDDDNDVTWENPAIANARNLAKDMVRWTNGEHRGRNQVLQLFDEWADYEIGDVSPVTVSTSSRIEDDGEDDTLLR
jgi:ankyrin repeat protein